MSNEDLISHVMCSNSTRRYIYTQRDRQQKNNPILLIHILYTKLVTHVIGYIYQICYYNHTHFVNLGVPCNHYSHTNIHSLFVSLLWLELIDRLLPR